MAPHAFVRFCLDGIKKLVPTTWFKDGLNLSRYDPAKAYLVFYSPGDVQTPESLLKKVSMIPVFETLKDLGQFEGPDPSGYYRATICYAADSINEVMDYMAKKRTTSVPLHLVRETSYEKAKRELQPNTSKAGQSKGTSSSGKNVKASSYKKGKVEPSAGNKRQSSRTNVNALKQKLIAISKINGQDENVKEIKANALKASSAAVLGSNTSKGPKESGRSDKVGELRSCSKDSIKLQSPKIHQDKMSKQRHTEPEPSKKCKQKESKSLLVEQNVVQCSDSRNKKTSGHTDPEPQKEHKEKLSPSVSQTLMVRDDILLCSDSQRKKTQDHTEPAELLRVCKETRSRSVSQTLMKKDDVSLGTDSLIKETYQKVSRDKRKSIASSDSDDDDSFVAMEKHKQLQYELRKKEAELHQLREANKKLRMWNENLVEPNDETEHNDNNQEKDGLDVEVTSEEIHDSFNDQNLLEQSEGEACLGHDVNSGNLLVNTPPPQPSAAQQETQAVPSDDLKVEFEIYKRVKVSVPEDKLADLKKFGPGEKLDKSYVKLAAQLMWGSKYLREHSTDGRRNPKDPNATARPPVDFGQLQAVRELLIVRVNKEGDPMAAFGPRCSLAKVKRCIGEKIQSLITSECRVQAKTII